MGVRLEGSLEYLESRPPWAVTPHNGESRRGLMGVALVDDTPPHFAILEVGSTVLIEITIWNVEWTDPNDAIVVPITNWV